jgi:M6 family metalloprotease-like protein
MRHFSITILALLIPLFYSSSVYAVRATPYPIEITQPDGSKITYRLNGDEFFNVKTTLDGYALIADKNGFLTYAKPDLTGKLITTNIKASNIANRSLNELEFLKTISPNLSIKKTIQKNKMMRAQSVAASSLTQTTYPLTGTPKSLVILVNFTDKSFTTPSPQTAFTNLLNETGYSANGGTGSARDYFRDNSMGVFNPQFDVVGPFTLPHNMIFYGRNDISGNDTLPQQMVIDACKLASNNGVDFTIYDTDNDGIVDNIFIYYAGYNAAEGGSASSIWPHRWSLPNHSTKFNNKIIYDYACTSELRGNSGANMCGIGTFCHEFGHVLGLDDMYVTDASIPDHYTLSSWDIMDYGPYLNNGRTPPCYSSYERFFLKWLVPTELKTKQDATLDTLATSNKALLISPYGNHNLNGANPNPVEFFMLENRQKKGWDTYLPGHGLLITHVYYNAATWASNEPNNIATAMGVDIVEADGVASEASMAGDPFPGTSNVLSYSPTLRIGTNINKPLTNIKENNGIITFNFMGGAEKPSISTTGTPVTFSTIQGTPTSAQTITVNGEKLSTDIVLAFNMGLHFEMKKETDTNWSKTIILSPVDSIINNIKIQIRYNPTEPSFRDTHNDILVLNSANVSTIKVNLSGTSTRPVYVTPPVATAPTDSTLKSYVAHWNEVFDATGYYLTAYNISDGNTVLKEGFRNGLTSPNGWSISATGISTSTVYSGDSIPSVQLRNTGEYIQTDKYAVPATNLSFYIKSLTENTGYIVIKAWDNSQWNSIDSLRITAGLAATKTYSFDNSLNYNQFKLTYKKGTTVTSSIFIDDVTIKFSKKLEYNYQDEWVDTNYKEVLNIIPGRDYFYKVKASDKTYYTDGTVKYENITDFSNLIQLKLSLKKTTKFVNKNESLKFYRNYSGAALIQIPQMVSAVRVYSSIGQLLQIIEPTELVVPIKNLKEGRVYIIQAGENSIKIVY